MRRLRREVARQTRPCLYSIIELNMANTQPQRQPPPQPYLALRTALKPTAVRLGGHAQAFPACIGLKSVAFLHLR